MKDDVEKTMDELMEYLLGEVKSRNLPISEFKIQKLIFKIKMELGEDHPLYPKLPFYWYLKGPYSEVATKSYAKKLQQANDSKPKILIDYPEIENINAEILKNSEYFINKIDRDIYLEYAPYDFMYSYKYEIYDIAKSRCSVDFDIANYISKIYRCVSKLPIDEYFCEFNTKFSKLSTDLDLINDSGNFEKKWDLIKIPIIETWKTFVKGLRVKHKDKYYNNIQKEWDLEYHDYLTNFVKIVNETTSYIDFKNLPKYTYNESEKKINQTTLGEYLRR